MQMGWSTWSVVVGRAKPDSQSLDPTPADINWPGNSPPCPQNGGVGGVCLKAVLGFSN